MMLSLPSLPKRLRSVLERFDVEHMPRSETETTLHAEGGRISVLPYERCSAEQQAFMDAFVRSSFRPSYPLMEWHRAYENRPVLIDIPARSGIGKLSISPAPFDHVIVRIGPGNTILIQEEGHEQARPGIGSVELDIGPASKIDYVLLSPATPNPRILVRSARLSQDSRLDWHPHLLATNDAMAAEGQPTPRLMLDIHTLLAGPGSEDNLFGTYLGRQAEEYYLTYESTHATGNTKSNTVVHGCLMGRSIGIFNGQVTISPAGHGAQTFVGERCLLLGNQARHGSTPALSVNTNDVQAGHSSATSQIDEEQLFYAASRGLPTEEAKDLIVRGFLQTMLDHIPSAVRLDLPESLLEVSSAKLTAHSF